MTTLTCPRCGGGVASGAHFCSICGNDVSGQQGGLATEQISSQPTRLVGPDAAIAEQLEHLRQATIGEYEVYGELGRGGMATVYLARDLALDRKVAIKVMSPSLVHGEGMVERFKREARTAASLSHPNIIPVYAVRETDRILFFVMKFVQGRPLDSILKEMGPLPIPMIQAILQQVGSAFSYAHRRGIIHRDIKPANIMIDDEGWAVVTDFGIAKVSESQGLTMTGMTVGTPTYMSPEQCMAQEVTGASDQYSLGVVAYEMVTGRPPFVGASMMAIMYGHFNDTPLSIAQARPDCPDDLRTAIERMLEKDPAKRWPTVDEAIAEFGGQPLTHDDPTRSQLINLAKTGINSKLMEQVRTPSSPVPLGKRTQGGTAPATAARTRGGPSRIATAASTAPTVAHTPGIVASPRPKSRGGRYAAAGGVVAILGVGALLYLAPWRQRAQGTPAAPAPIDQAAVGPQNPVPSPVVDSAPRLAGSAPESTATVSSSPPPAGPKPQPQSPPRRATPTPAAPVPNPTVVAARRDDSLFQAMRSSAGEARKEAVSKGATAAELEAGDTVLRQASLLAAQGRVPDAVALVPRAIALWTEAGARARTRADTPRVQAPPVQAQLPPSPAPPTTAPATPVDERPEIEKAIRDYARAMESGDIVQIRRANPGLTSKQQSDLEAFFKAGGTLKPNWSVSGIEISGNSAHAMVGGSNAWHLKKDKGERPISWRAQLERGSSGWRLISVSE